MVRGRPRPFVDTNVLFSGLYSSLGPSASVLRQHAEGRIAIVISSQVLEELVGAIRAKKPDLLPLLRVFLTQAPPELWPDPTPQEIERARECINPADAPILAAALRSEADCIVTGNTRHFTPNVARRAGVAIFTPAEYEEQLARWQN